MLLTTHLLEEADKADRIAILHQGRTVAIGAPSQLRSELGSQVLSIQTTDQSAVKEWLESRAHPVQQFDNQLRVAGSDAVQIVAPISAAFGNRIQSLTLGQPSLEDVFVAKTGHRYW